MNIIFPVTYAKFTKCEIPKECEDACTSCFEPLNDGVVIGHATNVKQQDHLIHETCMKNWVKGQGNSCPECRKEVDLKDFLTPEELETKNPTRLSINARDSFLGLHAEVVVIIGTCIGAIAVGFVSLTIATVGTVAIAVFKGLPAAGMAASIFFPEALQVTALGTIGGAVGTIVAIAVARFFGGRDPDGIVGVQFGVTIMICCDFQIKSIAFGVLGIAGLGAGIIAVGVVAKGVHFVFTRLASQLQQQ